MGAISVQAHPSRTILDLTVPESAYGPLQYYGAAARRRAGYARYP